MAILREKGAFNEPEEMVGCTRQSAGLDDGGRVSDATPRRDDALERR
jgi:hypothetical protein